MYSQVLASNPSVKQVEEQKNNKNNVKKYVQMAIKDKLSIEEAKTIYNSFSVEEKEWVIEFLATEQGFSPDEFKQERDKYKNEQKKMAMEKQAQTHYQLYETQLKGYGTTKESWRQNVENVWGSPSNPAVYPSSYSFEYYCESKTNADPDKDYVFHYDINYNSDPDGLRYTVRDSSQVYLAFATVYGAKINTYAYNFNTARACLGTKGVFAAGGAEKVKSQVFYHYQ